MNDPRKALEAAGVPPENIHIYDDTQSMLEAVFDVKRKPRPKTLEDYQRVMPQVIALLGEISGMHWNTVNATSSGFVCPWTELAREALDELGLKTYDVPHKTDEFRNFWQTDHQLAQLSREKCGICGKPPHGDDAECHIPQRAT